MSQNTFTPVEAEAVAFLQRHMAKDLHDLLAWMVQAIDQRQDIELTVDSDHIAYGIEAKLYERWGVKSSVHANGVQPVVLLSDLIASLLQRLAYDVWAKELMVRLDFAGTPFKPDPPPSDLMAVRAAFDVENDLIRQQFYVPDEDMPDLTSRPVMAGLVVTGWPLKYFDKSQRGTVSHLIHFHENIYQFNEGAQSLLKSIYQENDKLKFLEPFVDLEQRMAALSSEVMAERIMLRHDQSNKARHILHPPVYALPLGGTVIISAFPLAVRQLEHHIVRAAQTPDVNQDQRGRLLGLANQVREVFPEAAVQQAAQEVHAYNYAYQYWQPVQAADATAPASRQTEPTLQQKVSFASPLGLTGVVVPAAAASIAPATTGPPVNAPPHEGITPIVPLAAFAAAIPTYETVSVAQTSPIDGVEAAAIAPVTASEPRADADLSRETPVVAAIVAPDQFILPDAVGVGGVEGDVIDLSVDRISDAVLEHAFSADIENVPSTSFLYVTAAPLDFFERPIIAESSRSESAHTHDEVREEIRREQDYQRTREQTAEAEAAFHRLTEAERVQQRVGLQQETERRMAKTPSVFTDIRSEFLDFRTESFHVGPYTSEMSEPEIEGDRLARGVEEQPHPIPAIWVGSMPKQRQTASVLKQNVSNVAFMQHLRSDSTLRPWIVGYSSLRRRRPMGLRPELESELSEKAVEPQVHPAQSPELSRYHLDKLEPEV